MRLVKNRRDVVMFFATVLLGFVILFVAILVDVFEKILTVFASFLVAYVILERIGYYRYKKSGGSVDREEK